MQKQPELCCKKAVHKTFEMFTGKCLCWRLFLILNISKFLRPPILKNICKRLLLKLYSWKLNFSTSKQRLEKMYASFFDFISWLVSFEVCIYIWCFFDAVRNKLQTSSKISFRAYDLMINSIPSLSSCNFDKKQHCVKSVEIRSLFWS